VFHRLTGMLSSGYVIFFTVVRSGSLVSVRCKIV
jgi:hypothetical protein